MSARVVHFEVPFDDADRARAFYRDVFDWQIQSVPEMAYNLVSTGPVGRSGSDRAGLHRRGHARRQVPVTAPVITLQVDDIDATLGIIEEARRLRGRWEDAGWRHGFRRLFSGQRGQCDGPLAERSLARLPRSRQGEQRQRRNHRWRRSQNAKPGRPAQSGGRPGRAGGPQP